MDKKFLLHSFGYGFLLWLFGYILGIIFYAFIPKDILGWVIMPFGIALTLWVLFKKIKSKSFEYFLSIAIIWLVLAVALDYIFIIKLLNPEDYYKFDVFIYYGLTFLLPLLAWHKKTGKN